MTKSIRTLGNRPRYFPVSPKDTDPPAGSARIAAYAALPEVLTGFGVDLADVLDAARLPSNIFDDPESRISYADVGRLVAVSVQQTKCDHIGLLIGQGSGLAAMGLVGQIALCADTVGEGLQNFARFFTLQNTAATVDVITSGAFTRLVYAIAEPGMADTSQLQLGAMAIAFNILQDLCGPEWLPTAITVASSAPSNLRPCQKFFRAPLRFDSNESSIIFESHWLDRPLPPMDSQERMRIEAELQAQRAAIMADYTATVRRIVRKQLLIGGCSMDHVAAQLDGCLVVAISQSGELFSQHGTSQLADAGSRHMIFGKRTDPDVDVVDGAVCLFELRLHFWIGRDVGERFGGFKTKLDPN